MPLAEAQSEWIADVLEGKVELPGAERMRARDRPRPRERWRSATWPPSATRSRSTSTPTCGSLERERRNGGLLGRRRSRRMHELELAAG